MNKVTNWQYEKPTEPGIYLCCYGDIETADNMWLIRLDEDCDGYYKTICQYRSDEVRRELSEYPGSVKYAKLEFNDE